MLAKLLLVSIRTMVYSKKNFRQPNIYLLIKMC